MSDRSDLPVQDLDSSVPQTTAMMPGMFADLYRQEIGAEEDVHRTLPFFGTALGIVIGALAYAAGRLPKWPELVATPGVAGFGLAMALLACAIAEAGMVLVYLSRATRRREYLRIGPEPALQARLIALRRYYDGKGIIGDQQDRQLATEMQRVLLESYMEATPSNRRLNERRYEFRAMAASHLIRSLIWALSATSIILVSDKLGYFPRVVP